MANITNNNRFTTVSTLTDSSPDQIKDGADFPHTGLIKALSLGMTGNYVISGFNITATSDTSLTVANGVIFRDGLKESANGATLTLSTTYTNGYHLVVVPAGSAPQTVVLRNPSAQDKVAEYTDGDVIIAVATYTGNDPMQIQFLTTNKTANGLTVGFDSSGYSEIGEISAIDTSQMLIKTTASNADIKLLPHGSGDVKLGGNLAVDGNEITSASNGDITIAPHGTGDIILGDSGSSELTVTSRGIRDLKLTTNSGTNAGNITIGGQNADLEIAPHGTGDIYLNGDVGVGTSAPTCELEVRGTDDDAVDFKVSRNSTQFTGIRNSDATGAILQNHSPESNKKTLYFDNVHDSSGSAAGTNNFVFRAGASSAPTEILRIEDTGNLKMANGKTIRSPQLQTVSKSANYTLVENDAGKYIIVTASATITLPSSSNTGQHYTILNTHSSDITVARNGNDINGSSADITVGTFGGVTCIGIGSNDWIALGV
jgi:hypothetical protein